jgi:HEAT repeat protein
MRNAVEEFKYTVPYQKKWCRKLIMNRILMMKQNFQLDTFTILNIYKLFDFEKTTYDLLRNKKWHKRSLGAYQLQFINDDSNNSQLDSLLQEKNVQVKSNALITLVTFSPERFCILADYEGTITKADEIKLIDIIYHSALTIPKNTKSLLASKNTSIVILGIKLLVLYKVKLSKQELNKLIRLSNFRVRKEAIEAVGKLNIKGANEILINQYQIEQHKNIKINILVSLKKIGNKKTVLFLKSILLKEKDTDIKFKIIESIINLNPLFFEDKIQSETFNDLEIQSMARHVNDPLLV